MLDIADFRLLFKVLSLLYKMQVSIKKPHTVISSLSSLAAQTNDFSNNPITLELSIF